MRDKTPVKTDDRKLDTTSVKTGAPRWRVVVLDDEERSRAALGADVVSAGGRTAAESARCAGALELVQRARADVAIVAAHLPDGDAVDVAAETTTMAGCPVVMVGREATASLVARALEAGVMAFLIKPLRRGQLAPTLDLAVARFRETQRLKRALEERKVVERAKGRLMDGERMSEQEAFRFLQTTAMNTRRPMVEVARRILTSAGALPRPPAVAAASLSGPALGGARPRSQYGWTVSRAGAPGR